MRREGYSGRLSWAIVLVVVLIPVYCLSSGPAALLLCKNEMGARVWNWAYWPILHTLDGTSAHDDFLAYVTWWVNLDNPSGPYDYP